MVDHLLEAPMFKENMLAGMKLVRGLAELV